MECSGKVDQSLSQWTLVQSAKTSLDERYKTKKIVVDGTDKRADNEIETSFERKHTIERVSIAWRLSIKMKVL